MARKRRVFDAMSASSTMLDPLSGLVVQAVVISASTCLRSSQTVLRRPVFDVVGNEFTALASLSVKPATVQEPNDKGQISAFWEQNLGLDVPMVNNFDCQTFGNFVPNLQNDETCDSFACQDIMLEQDYHS